MHCSLLLWQLGGGRLSQDETEHPFPSHQLPKTHSADDERTLHNFDEKRMAAEVAADALGGEWEGYRVLISSGNDKQGFPMKQEVLTPGRVHLLLGKGHSRYKPRRTGGRRHKSVWGCTVGANLRAPKISQNPQTLQYKEDDVHQYVMRKCLNEEGKQPGTKVPKTQHFGLPHFTRKKQHAKQNKEEATDYTKLLAKRMKEAKEKHQEQIAKRWRLSSLRASPSAPESSQNGEFSKSNNSVRSDIKKDDSLGHHGGEQQMRHK
ncbi:hypothetical protein GH733_019339 [Mirounga leonina]|nr:hypothetical protein GH733_019339 [Mirounga leonina]